MDFFFEKKIDFNDHKIDYVVWICNNNGYNDNILDNIFPL